ncbi:MAG: formylmethanofuran dehydrogenase subunit [Planctomycetota bacterium]|nr:formylmethanofuran dehydrogenase subunit [Planctomycetota bacterium]
MPDADRTIADATCTACGCLCDDIVLTVSNHRIVAAEHACPIGAAWFLADHGPGDRPIATIEGQPATAEQALGRAAEILAKSRSPLIVGLTRTSLETQARAVAIADRLGAAIDPGDSGDSLPRWRAIQRVGIVSATLGEVKNRADVIVFWGVDPITTHPRHLERYSVGPRGRFVPEGRAGRTVVVVDVAPTATSAVADRFVRIVADEQGEVLATLRALVLGVEMPEAEDPVRELAETLKTARYGAFFFGPDLGRSRGGEAVVEDALKLVRDLNHATRFVALTLGGPGNPSGAEAVLTWQAGSPRAVDFSAGFPQFLPDDATAEAMLSQGRADAVLIVADDPTGFLSGEARAHLGRIPTIVIGPDATSRDATVALGSATMGIHSGGTIMRCDGATLPLRPALATTRPSDLEWLTDLERRLTEIPGEPRAISP